jgi:hypothetical protein
MEGSEPVIVEAGERCVVKYFDIKRWDNKKITAELNPVFQDSAISNSTVKRSIRSFTNGM